MADMEKARAAFDRFDADGDGQVTPEEFKHAMAEMGDPFVTGPVAEAVIQAKDTDSDGRMSFDEFWQALQA
ncbi:EF-hand domain-containing protein [Streptomyces platensis]|uniref:EF-hand domain-containing protein n=1 Tax=Streptomyces platensis TaxID=58346 RepID=UPI0038687EEE|nr:EF-hand domain-containing protein [Streptomyces platensis]